MGLFGARGEMGDDAAEAFSGLRGIAGKGAVAEFAEIGDLVVGGFDLILKFEMIPELEQGDQGEQSAKGEEDFFATGLCELSQHVRFLWGAKLEAAGEGVDIAVGWDVIDGGMEDR